MATTKDKCLGTDVCDFFRFRIRQGRWEEDGVWMRIERRQGLAGDVDVVGRCRFQFDLWDGICECESRFKVRRHATRNEEGQCLES